MAPTLIAEVGATVVNGRLRVVGRGKTFSARLRVRTVAGLRARGCILLECRRSRRERPLPVGGGSALSCGSGMSLCLTQPSITVELRVGSRPARTRRSSRETGDNGQRKDTSCDRHDRCE